MKKYLILIFAFNFILISSQKKDTLLILLQDYMFSKSINDTIIFDKNVNTWVYKKEKGKYVFLDKNVGFTDGTIIKKDTVLYEKQISRDQYKIFKHIYANNLEAEQKHLRNYIKVLDSCDTIFNIGPPKKPLDKKEIQTTEDTERSKLYKCYHTNFKSNQLYLTPYIFWRNDSNSDSIKVIQKINTPTFKGDFKTDTRLYKTLAELKDICSRNNGNVKCLEYYRLEPNLGLYLEKLDLKDYIIYINEDFIPEKFSTDDSSKQKKIMLNEYHFNKIYHKSRDHW